MPRFLTSSTTILIGALLIALLAPSLPAQLPQTRAELSHYTQTSTHADVLAFLGQLKAAQARLNHPALTFGTLGTTTEGRAIPYVVASRRPANTPQTAKQLGLPVVYIQANIHGGEVEGKEAILALLRDLVFSPQPNVLDSLVLFVVPIYNADGNDHFGPQAINRREQNGPALIGTRANAQGMDLNRDYVKAEAPETRAFLHAFNLWQPDVFIDLHTTDGSFHGYALTYAPSLAPAASTGAFTRDSILPRLRARMRERHKMETFDYGDFYSQDTLARGWYTFAPTARFATNYAGLRNAISILSEAYSHDPFERRVAATRAFVQEILSLVAEMGRREFRSSGPIPIRSILTKNPPLKEIIGERMEHTKDSVVTEPGVPPGLRRTGQFDTVRAPIYDRFDPTLVVERPLAYWIPNDSALLARLSLHGIRVDTTKAMRSARVETIRIDSVIFAERVFQGHREARVVGTPTISTEHIPAQSLLVPMDQPLGTLAVYLLDSRSEDGFTTWNTFDAVLRVGTRFSIRRVLE